MSRLHLTVLQSNPSPESDPTQAGALYSPARYDFVWNATYTSFRAVPLKWWDDQSYIDYELDGVDVGHPDFIRAQNEPRRAALSLPPAHAERDDDGLPF